MNRQGGKASISKQLASVTEADELLRRGMILRASREIGGSVWRSAQLCSSIHDRSAWLPQAAAACGLELVQSNNIPAREAICRAPPDALHPGVRQRLKRIYDRGLYAH